MNVIIKSLNAYFTTDIPSFQSTFALSDAGVRICLQHQMP